MKALTVQQPWAWAIIHGGKDVENRTQLWKYRGTLAIHAGSRISERGMTSPLVSDAWDQTANYGLDEADNFFDLGAIIGTAQLVDVHLAHPKSHAFDDVYQSACCDSLWAEQAYEERGGTTRRDVVHLVLEDPQPVDPIPCKGRLGLWTPPVDVALQLEAVRV